MVINAFQRDTLTFLLMCATAYATKLDLYQHLILWVEFTRPVVNDFVV